MNSYAEILSCSLTRVKILHLKQLSILNPSIYWAARERKEKFANVTLNSNSLFSKYKWIYLSALINIALAVHIQCLLDSFSAFIQLTKRHPCSRFRSLCSTTKQCVLFCHSSGARAAVVGSLSSTHLKIKKYTAARDKLDKIMRYCLCESSRSGSNWDYARAFLSD
jgi:hypothetical protein